jgi:hypothetical protein
VKSALTDNRFSFLLGQWTYRSLDNKTDEKIDFSKLEFGRGLINLSQIDLNGKLNGKLAMPENYIINLSGSIFAGDSLYLSISMQGDGIVGTPTEGWQYNYQGFLLPNNVAFYNVPKPVIAGIVMRTKDHGPTAKAGFSATFYMVQH